MTREEAERECARLASEDADRKTHSWLPRRLPDGDWSVVKVDLPATAANPAAELRADERPATPDDPRVAAARNTPHGGPL